MVGLEWWVGLSSNYQNPDGSLNTASSLVSVLNCLEKATGTDLGSPIHDTVYGRSDALNHLRTFGRPDVKRAIILLSDGEALLPASEPNPCQYAEARAAAAKASGIDMFTIGFGIGGKSCTDASGSYVAGGDSVSRLLARMASGGAGDQCANPAAENADGDNFFCQPKSADLSGVFLAAASQLAAGASLVDLPGS